MREVGSNTEQDKTHSRIRHKEGNPFKTEKAKKSVDLGMPGETPKKFHSFNQSAPVETLRNTLSDDETPAPPSSSSDRPKTSRGKSHPTPDDFYNYVVPSPDTGKIKSKRILIHGSESEKSDVESEVGSKKASKNKTKLSENYLLGLNLDGVSRDKQIALLGCWLFGSAMRI